MYKILLFFVFFLHNQWVCAQDIAYFEYTVKESDKSLWNICQRFQTTVSKVVALNQKDNFDIQKGEKLKVHKKENFIVHRVSKEDKSLWSIGQLYNVPLWKIKQLNGKSRSTIYIGEVLIIKKSWIPLLDEKAKTVAYSLWKNMGYPVFDLKKYSNLFPYRNLKKFRITPSTIRQIPNLYKLTPIDYVSMYQWLTTTPYSEDGPTCYHKMKELYFYSIEAPIILDEDLILEEQDIFYLSPETKRKVKNGFTYDLVTHLEVDSVQNSAEIIMTYFYGEKIGEVYGLGAGDNPKGHIADCYGYYTLAYYHKNDSIEIDAYSEFIAPMILKTTTVKKHVKSKTKYKIDSSMMILSLETYDGPAGFIDEAHYVNGRVVRKFDNKAARRRYRY